MELQKLESINVISIKETGNRVVKHPSIPNGFEEIRPTVLSNPQ